MTSRSISGGSRSTLQLGYLNDNLLGGSDSSNRHLLAPNRDSFEPERCYRHGDFSDPFQDSTTHSSITSLTSPQSSSLMEMSDDNDGIRVISQHDDTQPRLVIGIDFGTTFTGVAFATPTSDRAELDKIDMVLNWGQKMTNDHKVPSIFSYSLPKNGEQQWGADVSPTAITMVNTKLELEVQQNKQDELELLEQVLDNVRDLNFSHIKNAKDDLVHTWKDPEGIVSDYFKKIFERVYACLGGYKPQKQTMPVDIVITVPVEWSYRAKNSTVRAVRSAGFNEENFPLLNNLIFITEPEAAAIYTARYLKEDKKTEFLQVGHCFILCDAGGGTVDVVAFRVARLDPTLELEKMTEARSGKCGSAFVDTYFKRWLKAHLGDRNWKILDPNSTGSQISTTTLEGEKMRAVIKAFGVHKRAFSTNVSTIKMDMPKEYPDLYKIDVPKLKDGQLTITKEEMIEIFDPCINNVVKLIDEQIDQLEDRGKHAKNLFLVGGFGESPHLRDEVGISMDRRDIIIRTLDELKSLTAVVQGAVIHGIEKSHTSLLCGSVCRKNYGIVMDERHSIHNFHTKDHGTNMIDGRAIAKSQIRWVVKKGDLISIDSRKRAGTEFCLKFREHHDRNFSFAVYEYDDGRNGDGKLPERFHTHQDELIKATTLECNLTRYDVSQFSSTEDGTSRHPYYVAYIKCNILCSLDSTEFELTWNGEKLFSTVLKVEDQTPPRPW